MITLYQIGYNGPLIYHRYLGATELASNGESDDQHVALYVAIGERDAQSCAVAFLATNGDPVLVATALLVADTRYVTAWDQLDWELSGEAGDFVLGAEWRWLYTALRKQLGVELPDRP